MIIIVVNVIIEDNVTLLYNLTWEIKQKNEKIY